MSRVVVTRALPLDLASLLCDDAVIVGGQPDPMGRGELEREVSSADALICFLTDRIDERLLALAPRLQVVANFAVGHDNIDVAAATRLGIFVANTPNVLTEATADFTFALLLAAARRVVEGDQLVRSGEWRGWEPGQLLGAEVFGATLGIVGLGRIGIAVARRARGFGMRVVYAGPRRAPGELEEELSATWLPLDSLLEAADFVSLHCPLREETRGLIGGREIALMKPGAILVNTARGPLVDEDALACAIRERRLAGAGLDVFAREPEVAPDLTREPRVVLAPHLGSATQAARRRMAELCASAVASVLSGRRPENLVNPEALRRRK